MVLGQGVRDAGAECDLISDATPGVGYMMVDGTAQPVSVRAFHVIDDDIATLAAQFRLPRAATRTNQSSGEGTDTGRDQRWLLQGPPSRACYPGFRPQSTPLRLWIGWCVARSRWDSNHGGGAPIRVNLIAAGFVATPLSASLLGDQIDNRRNELASTVPIGRVVTPEDVARLALHLMVNTALTGATYDIDGRQQFV